MSSSLRGLQSRHEAWRSFRNIAHATRALAAARRTRWAGHTLQTGQHLAWVSALAQLVPETAPAEPRPRVLVAIGTDLGLCGRLNHLVADELLRRHVERTFPLTVLIGERLGQAVSDQEGWSGSSGALVQESAPVSPAAVLELAERLELTLQDLRLRDSLLEIVAAVSEEGGTPDVAGELGIPSALERDVLAIKAGFGRERRYLSDFAKGRGRVRALLRHARLAHAFCRAQVVESSVRWAVMHRAHEGAQRRIGEQELEIRRLRQEEITQEMLDIVGGRGVGV